MRSSSRYVWFVFTLIALSQAQPAHAQAEERRVALIDLGPALERAARSALEPWRVELLVVSEPSPGATAPRTNQAARALAQKHETSAVVWLSEYQHGYALWIYDLTADHTVARRLTTPPPFDGPTAAALALTLKTLLRHSAAAPMRERYGATATRSEPSSLTSPAVQPAPSSPPTIAALAPSSTPPSAFSREEQPLAAAAQPPTLPASPRSGAPPAAEPTVPTALPATAAQPVATVAKAASREPRAAVEATSSGPPELELEATGGVRLLFLGRGTYAPRFGAALTWWPRASPAGVLLRAASGPTSELRHALFQGNLRVSSAGLSGRLRSDLTRKLRISAALGAAADLTRLTGGTADSPGVAVTRVRVIPSLALELTSYWLLTTWLRLGVRFAGAWLPRPPHYEVDGTSIAKVSNITLESGISLAFGSPLPDRL